MSKTGKNNTTAPQPPAKALGPSEKVCGDLDLHSYSCCPQAPASAMPCLGMSIWRDHLLSKGVIWG